MANQPTLDGIRKNRVRRMAPAGLTVRARRIKDRNAIGYGGVEFIDGAGERVVRKAGVSWEGVEQTIEGRNTLLNLASAANARRPAPTPQLATITLALKSASRSSTSAKLDPSSNQERGAG